MTKDLYFIIIINIYMPNNRIVNIYLILDKQFIIKFQINLDLVQIKIEN